MAIGARFARPVVVTLVTALAAGVFSTSCTSSEPSAEGDLGDLPSESDLGVNLAGDLGDAGAPGDLPPRSSPIREENAHTGGGGWRLQAAGGISLYVDRTSYDPGTRITVYAAAPARTTARWELWRVGHYGGAGGRLILSGGPVDVPAATTEILDSTTGAVRAGWPATFTIDLPSDATTGVYLVKAMPTTGGGSYALAVVREAAVGAPVLLVLPVNTYQAYNTWGGTSLYNNRRTDFSRGQAEAVSFERPYVQGDGAGQLWVVGDAAMIDFVESQGWDVAYATDLDLDERGAPQLVGRELLGLLGHSEYWTRGMRDATETAIARGTHVAFFGANDCYWQVRWGDAQRRLLIGYKEAAANDPIATSDPSLVTTNWRAAPLNRPENALIGVMFGEWQIAHAPLLVDAPDHWLWRGTGSRAGDLIAGAVGYESDRRFDNGQGPTRSMLIGHALVENHDGKLGAAEATVYEAPSGATVFAAGTLGWGLGVGGAHVWDVRLRAATANLFARLGHQGAGAGGIIAAPSPPTPDAPMRRAGVTVETITDGLISPTAVVALPGGAALIADGNRLVSVNAAGALNVVAGDVTAGNADGPAASARFANIRGLAVASDGTIYIADTGNTRIRRLAGGVVSTLAGSSSAGIVDATGTAARFIQPMGLALTSGGALLVADPWSRRVRAVSPSTGAVTTWAGTGAQGIADGPGARAQLYAPFAIAALPDGGAAFVEAETGLVRRVSGDAAHSVSTLAGELGRAGWADGDLATASVYDTMGIATRSSAGQGLEVVLLDGATYRVRRLVGGRIETLAGGATAALVDGSGERAGFLMPRGAAWLSDGSLAVVDAGNRALRRLRLP